MNQKTRIIISLPIDTKNQLDAQANKENRTVTNIVSTLITNYLNNANYNEHISYYNYLATEYLRIPFNYSCTLSEVCNKNLMPTDLNNYQQYDCLKNYLITFQADHLVQFANQNNLPSFENYISTLYSSNFQGIYPPYPQNFFSQNPL